MNEDGQVLPHEVGSGTRAMPYAMGAHRVHRPEDVAPPEVLHHVTEGHRPPWNAFDTFLRRAAMVAIVALLWTFIIGFLVAVFAGSLFMGALSDALGTASTVDAPYYQDLPGVGDN